jgi:hypothetical protein
MKKRLLTVGIIFLFLVVGFQPAFADENKSSITISNQIKHR